MSKFGAQNASKQQQQHKDHIGSEDERKGNASSSSPSSSSPSSSPSAASATNHYAIYDVKGVKPHIRTIFDACERGNHQAIMKFAKDKDFDIDAKDRFGRTALIWAADCGHLRVCETLIRLNASINTTDSHTGRSAIHWAARTGNLAIVRLLVQYGANINKEDKYGLTPLYLARSKGAEGDEVFQYLLSEGAPYNELQTFRLSDIEDRIRADMAALEGDPQL